MVIVLLKKRYFKVKFEMNIFFAVLILHYLDGVTIMEVEYKITK